MDSKWKHFLYIIFGYLLCIFPSIDALSPIINTTPIHEAFIPKFTDAYIPTIIAKAPPKPIIEQIPARPTNDVIWIPGYWAWIEEKNDYAWVCGIWRRSPPKNFWIPGRWTEYQGGWVWSRGIWSLVPFENLYYIKQPPPNSVDDKIPEIPGKNYFWAPGYWQYSIETESYNWLSGKWEQFNENWTLAPASYVWSPSGYIYTPMYWDWSLINRGFAYNCHNAARFLPSQIDLETIILQLYSDYPDYLGIYWHTWHFHPELWDNCNCIPAWWVWTEWWTLPWNDTWAFWWWWTHPGSLPPTWLTLDLTREIAPAPEDIVKLFAKIKKPPFQYKAGVEGFLAQGIPGFKHLAKPHVPNNVTPQDSIDVPPIPILKIKKPTNPTVTRPTTISTPLNPTEQQIEPNTPSAKLPIYYPSDDLHNLDDYEEPPRHYSPDRPQRPRHPEYPDQYLQHRIYFRMPHGPPPPPPRWQYYEPPNNESWRYQPSHRPASWQYQNTEEDEE